MKLCDESMGCCTSQTQTMPETCEFAISQAFRKLVAPQFEKYFEQIAFASACVPSCEPATNAQVHVPRCEAGACVENW